MHTKNHFNEIGTVGRNSDNRNEIDYMSFDSVLFISIFLPGILILYALIRGKKGRNGLLLVCSLIFYAFSGLSGILLMCVSAVLNYGFGKWITHSAKKKSVLAVAISINLLFLFAFKYLRFLCGMVAPVIWESFSLEEAAVPLGISFFTFKSLSWLIDAYRNPQRYEGKFFDFLLYVCFFPQITAGPITRFQDFQPQLKERNWSLTWCGDGLRRFILGLGKKLLLSGAAARVADAVFSGKPCPDLLLSWLGAVSYMLQIYYDFSGYSDMAIGLGQMFGFITSENFRYPYIAGTITEFWRRWHISLSSWFRDYLYIPLGGSRRGKYRTVLNKLVVFTLCGLWHGANWTFVVWGIWHGILAGVEGFLGVGRRKPGRAGCIAGHIFTLLAVCTGFVMFRSKSLAEGCNMLRAMVGTASSGDAQAVAFHTLMTGRNILPLFLGILFATPLGDIAHRKVVKSGGGLYALRNVLYVLLLGLCLCELSAGSFFPFIYAQF